MVDNKFSTQITITEPNVRTIHITSPKTNESIHIFEGWFMHIPNELLSRIFVAWADHLAKRQDAKSSATEFFSNMSWLSEHKCIVELTLNDLTALYNIYRKQQGERAAASKVRNQRRKSKY